GFAFPAPSTANLHEAARLPHRNFRGDWRLICSRFRAGIRAAMSTVLDVVDDRQPSRMASFRTGLQSELIRAKKRVSMPALRLVRGQLPSHSGQWPAWREENPYHRTCGDHPAIALRRFLEFNESGASSFELVCGHDLAGNGRKVSRLRWVPPDLFVECFECR